MKSLVHGGGGFEAVETSSVLESSELVVSESAESLRLVGPGSSGSVESLVGVFWTTDVT